MRIRYILTVEDNSWAKEACRHLDQEIQVLQRYYDDRLLRENAEDELIWEKDLRIQELKRRSQPRVLASPLPLPCSMYRLSLIKPVSTRAKPASAIRPGGRAPGEISCTALSSGIQPLQLLPNPHLNPLRQRRAGRALHALQLSLHRYLRQRGGHRMPHLRHVRFLTQ